MSRTVIPFPFFDIDITNFPGFSLFRKSDDENIKKLNKELTECKEKIATLETQVSQLSSQVNPPPKYSPGTSTGITVMATAPEITPPEYSDKVSTQ